MVLDHWCGFPPSTNNASSSILLDGLDAVVERAVDEPEDGEDAADDGAQLRQVAPERLRRLAVDDAVRRHRVREDGVGHEAVDLVVGVRPVVEVAELVEVGAVLVAVGLVVLVASAPP